MNTVATSKPTTMPLSRSLNKIATTVTAKGIHCSVPWRTKGAITFLGWVSL